MQLTDGEYLHNTVLNAPIGICILDAATLVAEIVNAKFLEVAGKPYEAFTANFTGMLLLKREFITKRRWREL